jgi:uncharacterized membrane protein
MRYFRPTLNKTQLCAYGSVKLPRISLTTCRLVVRSGYIWTAWGQTEMASPIGAFFVLLVVSALQITWDMEHIWQAASRQSGEEFPSPHLIFMWSGGSFLYKMVSNLDPKNTVFDILVLFSHVLLSFNKWSFFYYQLKFYSNLSYSVCMLHFLPVSSSLALPS